MPKGDVHDDSEFTNEMYNFENVTVSISPPDLLHYFHLDVLLQLQTLYIGLDRNGHHKTFHYNWILASCINKIKKNKSHTSYWYKIVALSRILTSEEISAAKRFFFFWLPELMPLAAQRNIFFSAEMRSTKSSIIRPGTFSRFLIWKNCTFDRLVAVEINS